MFQVAGISPKAVKAARASLLLGGAQRGRPWPLGTLPAYPNGPSLWDPQRRGPLQRPSAAASRGVKTAPSGLSGPSVSA